MKPTPGGAFPPNAFGLYDVSGNVWKRLSDCWNSIYDGRVDRRFGMDLRRLRVASAPKRRVVQSDGAASERSM